MSFQLSGRCRRPGSREDAKFQAHGRVFQYRDGELVLMSPDAIFTTANRLLTPINGESK